MTYRYLASLDIFHVWLAMFSVSVLTRLGTKRGKEKKKEKKNATEIRRDINLTVPLITSCLPGSKKKKRKKMTFDVFDV